MYTASQENQTMDVQENIKVPRLARGYAKLPGIFDPFNQVYITQRSTFCSLTVSSQSEYTICFLTEQFAVVPLSTIKQISGMENARLQR